MEFYYNRHSNKSGQWVYLTNTSDEKEAEIQGQRWSQTIPKQQNIERHTKVERGPEAFDEVTGFTGRQDSARTLKFSSRVARLPQKKQKRGNVLR